MVRSIGLMTAAPYSFTLHQKKNLEEWRIGIYLFKKAID
jgi:hypothetical protein